MSHITTDNARARVTQVLRRSTKPMTAEELSRLSGVAIHQTKSAVCALVVAESARNVGGKQHAAYLWQGSTGDYVPATPSWKTAGPYRGEPALPMRPGAQDFLQCPHLINGERVTRTRPKLVSYRGEESPVLRDDDEPARVVRGDE